MPEKRAYQVRPQIFIPVLPLGSFSWCSPSPHYPWYLRGVFCWGPGIPISDPPLGSGGEVFLPLRPSSLSYRVGKGGRLRQPSPPPRLSPTYQRSPGHLRAGVRNRDGVVFPCLPFVPLIVSFPSSPECSPARIVWSSCIYKVSIPRNVCSFSRVFWGTSIVLVCAPISFFVLEERKPFDVFIVLLIPPAVFVIKLRGLHTLTTHSPNPHRPQSTPRRKECEVFCYTILVPSPPSEK